MWLLLGGTAQAVEVKVLDLKVNTAGVEQTASGTLAATTGPVRRTVSQVTGTAATTTAGVVSQVDATVRAVATPRTVKTAPPAVAKPAPRPVAAPPAAPASSAARVASESAPRHAAPARTKASRGRQSASHHEAGPPDSGSTLTSAFAHIASPTADAVRTAKADGSSPAEVPAIPAQTDLELGGGVSAGSASAALGAAVLLAMFFLMAPALRRRLVAHVGSCRPTPFVCVLERPG